MNQNNNKKLNLANKTLYNLDNIKFHNLKKISRRQCQIVLIGNKSIMILLNKILKLKHKNLEGTQPKPQLSGDKNMIKLS